MNELSNCLLYYSIEFTLLGSFSDVSSTAFVIRAKTNPCISLVYFSI